MKTLILLTISAGRLDSREGRLIAMILCAGGGLVCGCSALRQSILRLRDESDEPGIQTLYKWLGCAMLFGFVFAMHFERMPWARWLFAACMLGAAGGLAVSAVPHTRATLNGRPTEPQGLTARRWVGAVFIVGVAMAILWWHR